MAANWEADRCSNKEHAYHISEAGQCEQLKLIEQAHLDHKANVKYWNNIKMEEAMTAWQRAPIYTAINLQNQLSSLTHRIAPRLRSPSNFDG